MPNPITHNLTRLTEFRGRDTRSQFWPWAACVVGGAFALWMATVALMISSTIAKVRAFTAAHPEQVEITTFAGTTSVQIHGDHPALTPDFAVMGWAIGAIAIVAVGLLAAAVARRLHDRGRSAFWGLAPLPFLAFGLVGVQVVMREITTDVEPNMTLFLAIFLNNIVYLGVLLTLIIQLSGAGSREANRFGPPVG